MATFFQSKDTNLILNNQSIFCSDLSLGQSADISPVYKLGDSVTNKTISNGPVRSSLNFSFYFSGKCLLRDYIYTNSDYPLSGYLGGIFFRQGYLESYDVNVSPQSLININASIKICDELSGNLNKIVPSGPPTGVTQCTSNNITFNTSNFAAFTIENIKNFNWSYRANVEPIYYQKETGLSHINPDRIVISDKEINCTITTNSNNNNLLLPFTGDNYAIEMLVKHPSNTGIFETYGISGKINKKDFNISQNSIGESSYTITQWHLNEEPKIASIINTFLPNTGHFIINSPNLINGYFSSNKKLPLIEKVILGGEQLKFSLDRGGSIDTITGYTTNNSVNGSLEVQTTKGLIIYPTELSLNFSGIGVSGFKPETGNYHDTILISGTNFFKISQVLFNNAPANFQIKQNTGINGFHELIASVPDSATVGKITILSTLKNRSGISTGDFYPMPVITGFTPTGIFSGFYFVGGRNFSGTTNVYFNNINASTFEVVNNNLITGLLPGTGKGYTKGYVKLSGFQGMESPLSNNIYQPIVPIYALSALSGTIEEDIAISTIVDTDFLCPVDYGYKVAFGRVTGVFVPSGTGFLTGLFPNGFFNNGFVSIFEPDGVGKYPPFTGRITQVGPAPEIESIFPDGNNVLFHQYSYNNLNIYGQYFKDFFGLNTYLIISGQKTDPPSHDEYRYPLNVMLTNDSQSKVIFTGIRITGATGYYDVNLINYVGTGILTGLKISSGINWAQTSAVMSRSPASNAIVNGVSATSTPFTRTAHIGQGTVSNSGYFTYNFNKLITISKINCYQYSTTNYDNKVNSFLTNNSSDFFHELSSYIAISGMLILTDGGDNIVYSSGINWNNKTISFLHNPFTGINSMKLARHQPNTSPERRHLMFNTVQVL